MIHERKSHSMSDYKRVLTIQDISCIGQCSLTVALPLLSCCGLETAVLPSAVLSTHTGGFKGYTFRDLTEDMPKIAEHWRKEDLRFDAIYSGYLGSARQVEIVREIMTTLEKDGCVRIVDPAMADNGRMYAGFDDAFAGHMKELCSVGQILIPNITEACFLTGTPYREQYDREYIDRLINGLAPGGMQTVVLTGVSFAENTTGVWVRKDGEDWYYEHRRIAKGCHGTGDIYSSVFVGALMRGLDVRTAVRIAADYVVACLERTAQNASHWYGAMYETEIPYLMRLLETESAGTEKNA